MKGILFGTKEVDLHPDTPMGGSFNPGGVRGGVAYAYDPGLVKFVYERLKDLDNPVLVDVGASTGSFSLLTKFIPTLRVMAFEPNPTVFSILCDNLKRNGVNDRVLTVCAALTAKSTRRKLRLPRNPGMSGFATLGDKPSYESDNVAMVTAHTLDSVFNLDRLDFLKVDTEGCELYVFRGAVNTIKKFKPEIVYEHNAKATAQFGLKLSDATDFLKELGYTKFKIVGAEDMWARV
jgi:FkbM family methyltransferase